MLCISTTLSLAQFTNSTFAFISSIAKLKNQIARFYVDIEIRSLDLKKSTKYLSILSNLHRPSEPT